MLAINPLLVDTASPPIPEAQGWARAYDGKAGPLIDLSQAVPGYPPPDALIERIATAAGRRGTASYGPILGDAALREAYAAHVSALYGGPVKPSEVAISTGCNQAFMVAMLALARAGDAVVLPAPWYFNQKMALDMLGIETRPLICRGETGFVPDLDEAKRLIDGRTRALVLVTPNNPTGAIYPPETIAAFAALCRRRGIWLVIDATYRDFLPEGGRPHALFADEAWREGVIELYSFSKAYCIPGHRLGAMVAPEGAIAEIAKVQDTLQICPPRAAQAAIAWGIGALADWRVANGREIAARAAAFRAAFDGVNDWRISSIGSYFAFLRHPDETKSAAAIARELVLSRGVLTLPGPYFGPEQETHLRVAFANADTMTIGRLRERFAG